MKLSDFKTYIWDFDGVIKESVAIKEKSYIDLFSHLGQEGMEFVKNHNKHNSGISRLEKIPFYMKHFGLPLNDNLISHYMESFSHSVVQSVIDSPYVPGVVQFLEQSYQSKSNFLISGTPQLELEHILTKLNLKQFFKEIFGAPHLKTDALKLIKREYNLETNNTVFIGDSIVDMKAALENGVKFCLRRNTSNLGQSFVHAFKQIDDFNGE